MEVHTSKLSTGSNRCRTVNSPFFNTCKCIAPHELSAGNHKMNKMRHNGLSSSAISTVCRRMVQSAGLDVSVSSHLLRIGGATAAMDGGLSKEQIMAVGGWKSAAVECYLRACEGMQKGLTRRMGF